MEDDDDSCMSDVEADNKEKQIKWKVSNFILFLFHLVSIK